MVWTSNMQRVAKQAFTVFDCLPPLLKGCQIPPLAAAADDPEPTLGLVERQTATHGERFEDLVLTEALVAAEARAIHARPLSSPALSIPTQE